jgi:hypothetical protein
MPLRLGRLTPEIVGAAAVAGGLLFLPAPLGARILVAAPLLIVPRLLRFTSPTAGGIAERCGGWPALAAALPLLAAYALPPGWAAAVLALPWLALTAALALSALVDTARRVRRFGWQARLDVLTDAALGFLAIGGLFLASDRAGLAPLGFSSQIILLTAIHFHFAGFGLLLLATELARRSGSWVPFVAASVLVAGIPLTAAGFVMRSDVLNAIGALLVVASGVTAGICLAYADEPALRLAGVAFLGGYRWGSSGRSRRCSAGPFSTSS